jgi:hypothetical protein
MDAEEIYEASPLKRNRATKAEMKKRAEFLVGYAEAHGPVTVRGLYYQGEVAGLPGIDKTDSGYNKVQRQVLNLRRAKRLDYQHIADLTQWMRKPRSFSSVEEALNDTARLYRKALWYEADSYVEIWCEKDALAGVIFPTTAKYDVPLMPTKGYSSETFCYEAIAQRGGDDRPYYVYYLGDFDRAGEDAARALKEKLTRFAEEDDIEIIFEQLAVTEEQIDRLGLPTRDPKRKSRADKKWPHGRACELDAIPPDYLRGLVERAINLHLPQDQLAVLKVAETSEREQIAAFVGGLT